MSISKKLSNFIGTNDEIISTLKQLKKIQSLGEDKVMTNMLQIVRNIYRYHRDQLP